MNIVRLRSLTKSRFKVVFGCPTRRHYQANARVHSNSNHESDLLQVLADAGNQIGELAKYLYCNDPVGEQITVDSLQYDKAWEDTQKRISRPSRVVIAEAAIKYANFFIRVDILVHDPVARTLRVVEVKSRKVDEETVSRGFKGVRGNFAADWLPYLYDIAFQARVVQLAYPD